MSAFKRFFFVIIEDFELFFEVLIIEFLGTKNPEDGPKKQKKKKNVDEKENWNHPFGSTAPTWIAMPSSPTPSI